MLAELARGRARLEASLALESSGAGLSPGPAPLAGDLAEELRRLVEEVARPPFDPVAAAGSLSHEASGRRLRRRLTSALAVAVGGVGAVVAVAVLPDDAPAPPAAPTAPRRPAGAAEGRRARRPAARSGVTAATYREQRRLGILLALLVWGVNRGSTAYRVVLFLPYVLPQVAVGVVWGWIYEPTRGWLDLVLESVGLEAITTGWLGNPDTALYAVLATAVWTAVGFVFVIILSALRNVDTDQVDASLLDGANWFQRLRHIILPQILPVFVMVTAITLIGGFAVFDLVFVMTGGGPAGASDVLGTVAYSSAFQLSRISYGTTLALVVTAMAVPFAVWLDRVQRRLSDERTGG